MKPSLFQRSFLAVAGLGFASQLSATTLAPVHIVKIDKRGMERKIRSDAYWCAKATWHKNDLDRVFKLKKAKLDQLSDVADNIFEGKSRCKQNRALAIAIMERLVGPDPLTTERRDDLRSLVLRHETIATTQSKARAKELRRLMWVRGYFFEEYVQKEGRNLTAEDKRELFSNDAVWKFLTSYAARYAGGQPSMLYEEALFDPLSLRHDPVKYVARVEGNHLRDGAENAARLLLDGKYMPRDAARAEALLVKKAPYSEEALVLIFPLIEARLESKDVVVRDAAIKQLEGYVNSAELHKDSPKADAIRKRLIPFYTADLKGPNLAKQSEAATALTQYTILKIVEAEQLLMPWLEKNLSQGALDTNHVARSILRQLIRSGNSTAAKILEADMARLYAKAIDVGQLTAEHGNLAKITTENDYPPRAVRNEEQGIIEASVIIAPDGRIVEAQITRSAGETLDNAWLSLVSRRARRLTFPNAEGRYVKAKLPPVHFKLNPCLDSPSPDSSPQGAIVVIAPCIEAAPIVVLRNNRMN